MSRPLLVSRCDRLGDLILSLPALGFLRDAGFGDVWLHSSAYASAIGEWAAHNGLVRGVWPEGSEAPEALKNKKNLAGLSLFHCPEAVAAFKKLGIRDSVGPRTRLSAIWGYGKSVAQHRSRVEKSEMAYNVDMARAFLAYDMSEEPEFHGLPALKLPPSWSSPVKGTDLLVVASNGGSAHNWPMSRYIETAQAALGAGKSVQFLVHGTDAEERIREFRASKIAARAELLPSFATLRELIAHIASCGETLSSSTGPLHIAHAAGRPVTGIYPVEPKVQSFQRWRPDGYWHAAPVRWLQA
jgi:ADP-heptose:LPS heptosyltransferase